MSLILHASCVAFGTAAVLVTGASGAGKSLTALRLLALGAMLVADDRVALRAEGGRLLAAAPPAIAGLIEVRGAGLLRLPVRAEAEVRLLGDLDAAPEGRLPAPRRAEVLGVALPVLALRGLPDPAALLAVLLRAGVLPEEVPA